MNEIQLPSIDQQELQTFQDNARFASLQLQRNNAMDALALKSAECDTVVFIVKKHEATILALKENLVKAMGQLEFLSKNLEGTTQQLNDSQASVVEQQKQIEEQNKLILALQNFIEMFDMSKDFKQFCNDSAEAMSTTGELEEVTSKAA